MYVLPYTSWSVTYRPSRRERPMRSTRPSFTATTGAPAREKISMLRRVPSPSTTSAALPDSTRLPRLTWPAYVERAWTGKRPCVRPVSEPTRSLGIPPMTCARISTESTYQSAWL